MIAVSWLWQVLSCCPGCAVCRCHRGVLNIVHGTHDTVNRILDHPDIAAVSFVGGDRAGRYIYERAAANGKRVQVGATPFMHLVLPHTERVASLAVQTYTGGNVAYKYLLLKLTNLCGRPTTAGDRSLTSRMCTDLGDQSNTAFQVLLSPPADQVCSQAGCRRSPHSHICR